jgi:hypothetical protein
LAHHPCTVSKRLQHACFAISSSYNITHLINYVQFSIPHMHRMAKYRQQGYHIVNFPQDPLSANPHNDAPEHPDVHFYGHIFMRKCIYTYSLHVRSNRWRKTQCITQDEMAFIIAIITILLSVNSSVGWFTWSGGRY